MTTKTLPDVDHQSEAYPEGEEWRGQVVELNLTQNTFEVIWVSPRTYDEEEIAHAACRRWARDNGYGEIPPATDGE